MTSLTRRSLIVMGAATLLAACTTTIPVLPKSAASSPETLSDDEILIAINAVRRANGAPPWTYNSNLEAAARSQARLMAQKDTMSHDLGVTLRQRVTEAGYLGAVGENVGKGYTNLEGVIGGWMNSSGHRNTLLSTRFVEFGLAATRAPSGKLYWAMIAGGSYDAWRVY
ncbi:MAG: CAP domain-containing protein [Candidatus Devosia phytovorans]|uniref:CAP domain-containing protein n=1 Tax=Candidatus Devosia phytovorans TaxID=3121372 RepID=A0AAJ5VSQ6_9HYPH|nr:CAP domain-containing protein [Devosia sp.]WEK03195.1 MAG: CAP domain-containing protein [Devosia sp.]